MFEKVAIVGESDLFFAFRALGIKVFSPKNVEEAREVMEGIVKKDFALCFLDESFFELLAKERKALAKRFRPVFVGFSDYRKVTGFLERMMKEMAVKATGSDSLVKRKDKDERR